MKELFARDEIADVLEDRFYAKDPPRTRKGPAKTRSAARQRRAGRPDHYDTICISLYQEDLARLDAMVAELKAAGHRKMSRSALIRFALTTVDLDALPRSI
ncbi:MAG: hypothetical protein AAGF12_23650 [Myxococcota bacterium]